MKRRDALRSLAAGCMTFMTRSHAAPQGPSPEMLIRGGRVVNAEGIRRADVRIIGESIAETGANLKPGPGARILEADGRYVLPGGIDPHTHLHPQFADDLTSGSMAALAGGITTVGTFAYPQGGEMFVSAVERVAGVARSQAIADVFIHAAAWPPTPEVVAAMPALAAAGQPSFKVYMARRAFSEQLNDLIRLLESARDAGVVTLVHCEDGALLAAAVRRLEGMGRTSLSDYGASRPVVAEVAATQQVAALCESTRAPMYIVHLSSARALDACRESRASGLPLFVETRPLYLHLTEERMQGPDTPLYVGQPPLRTPADSQALWRGLAAGAIDVLATDHAPWTREQKMNPTPTISRFRPGVSNLQFMLPMYFSEGVLNRKLSLQRFVETTSANAARIFGLYPRKGVIRAGSDADLVIWDPSRTATISGNDDLSNSDYSVYEGWKVTGWPVTTIRRGEIVFDQGKVTGSPGTGRVIFRERWRR